MFDYGIMKSRSFSVPIISVGNITVGGTGKTPHVEYMVNILNEQFKTSVLSRGYKRKTKGFLIAKKNPSALDVGDEPAQIKRKFPDIEVAVDANRVRGAQKLIERNNEVIILDDAYQHRHINPGLSILLIDYNRPIDKDHILPCGNLREHKSGINRAEIIIFTKTPKDIKPIDERIALENLQPYPYQTVFFSYIKYGSFKSVFANKTNISDDFYNNHEIYTILLFTGIANSKPLKDYLKKYTNDIEQLEFPDHTKYTENKIAKIVTTYESISNKKKILVTTEKDSVKLRELENVDETLINNTFYLPIEIDILDNKTEFNNQIIEYVKRN